MQTSQLDDIFNSTFVLAYIYIYVCIYMSMFVWQNSTILSNYCIHFARLPNDSFHLSNFHDVSGAQEKWILQSWEEKNADTISLIVNKLFLLPGTVTPCLLCTWTTWVFIIRYYLRRESMTIFDQEYFLLFTRIS